MYTRIKFHTYRDMCFILKYYVVKEKFQDQTIEIIHKSTKEMLADPLTKGLSPEVFKKHVAGMGLRECL